jgi:short-chain fatty acids transporter
MSEVTLHSRPTSRILASLGAVVSIFTSFSERFIPGAFSIAIILTFFVFGLAMVTTDAGPAEVIIAWGNGFWTLVQFAMQMAIVALTGFLVSVSPPVERVLARVARLATTPRGAVTLMAVTSMSLAWVHWGVGMMACAMLVRHIARAQPNVDYRLLVCAAYLGIGATWHAGLSGSAPLLVATPGHFLEAEIGIIPASATIFQPFSLVLVIVVLVVLSGLVWALHPTADKTLTIEPAALGELDTFQPPASGPRNTVAAHIDHGRWLNVLIGLCGVGWLAWYFATQGFVLTLDVVNFALLTTGILLHPSPASVVAAADQGARLMSGIVLQFPFYAGMFGVIQGTGLAELLGELIASAATPETYPLLVYWYSGIVNYFVPSGGSKWAIEAPFLIDAAQRLGVSIDQVVIAYSWGDMSTNLIQPFWALPLLAAARLGFRDIVGYTAVVFLVNVAVVSLAFWLLPTLW